jgi:predicted ATP-dependent protease
VTGSVNQWGDIQAIGGVNEKIEGFYDVCAQRGLSGTQGVIIPQSNVRNLMLRLDVVEAIRQGRFHIYSVSHIDQGLALLTGVAAGGIDTPDTIHAMVNTRLTQLAKSMVSFGEAERNGSNAATPAATEVA